MKPQPFRTNTPMAYNPAANVFGPLARALVDDSDACERVDEAVRGLCRGCWQEILRRADETPHGRAWRRAAEQCAKKPT